MKLRRYAFGTAEFGTVEQSYGQPLGNQTVANTWGYSLELGEL